MSYRDALPQLDGELFLTDGGIETSLIFHQGLDLPAFAAFVLLDDEHGTEELRRYYAPYLALARDEGVGFVLESPTWRASPRWGAELGYSEEQLDALNRRAIALMEELRDEAGTAGPVVISGCIGPQDDGYNPTTKLSADEARDYHATQIGTFRDTPADMVTAMTLTYAEEAIGLARAASDAGIPAVISFTVETDGRLPSGQGLGEAIDRGRRGDGRSARLLHDQLRPPDALRVRGRRGRAVGRASPRPARERLEEEPRRAGRGRGPGRGRPGGPGRQPRRAARQAAAAQRARRLLRHRSPPRRRDLPRLARRDELAPDQQPPTPATSPELTTWPASSWKP